MDKLSFGINKGGSMKLVKKASLMILGISLLLARPVFADIPKINIISWEYNQQNKTWKAYKDGALQKSWLYWNGYWYYLDIVNGEMKKSWLQLADGSRYFLSEKPDKGEGQMLKGWHWIGGYCYYFSESAGKDEGKLMTNTLVEGRYRVDTSGRWVNEEGVPYQQNIASIAGATRKSVSGGGSARGSSRRSSGGGSTRGSLRGLEVSAGSLSELKPGIKVAEDIIKPQEMLQESAQNKEDAIEKQGNIDKKDTETKKNIENVTETGVSKETGDTAREKEAIEQPEDTAKTEENTKTSETEDSGDIAKDLEDNKAKDNAETSEKEQASDTGEHSEKDVPNTENSDREEGLVQENSGTEKENPEKEDVDKEKEVEVLPETSIEEIEKNENTSTYTTEAGEERTILWVKGVEPLSMGEGGAFRKEVTGSYVEYILPYTENQAWYDVNKNTIGSLQDLNLCFAAVSSNMLHWWLEQNGQYIEKYLTMGAESRKDEASELQNLERYVDSFTSQQSSKIFDMFKYYYGYRKDGYVSTILLDWFINGYTPSKTGAINREKPDFVPDKRLGFFYPVFKEKLLTRKMFSGNYESFSDLVKDALESGQIMGVEHHFSLYGTTHIITLWGAEFDDVGKIQAIYVTDSDDNSREEEIGMKRYAITKDSSGYPRLNNNTAGNSYGARLEYVHTLDLGTAYWEAYFKGVE